MSDNSKCENCTEYMKAGTESKNGLCTECVNNTGKCRLCGEFYRIHEDEMLVEDKNGYVCICCDIQRAERSEAGE